MDVRAFLKTNGLKQRELAYYLGVTEAAISNVVKGKSDFAEENLIKILNNPNGWDTSMLVESEPEPAQTPAQPVDYVKGRLFALLDDQSEQIKMLLGMLKEKDEEIRQLREELDERKRGTAPSVGTSSAAKAV